VRPKLTKALKKYHKVIFTTHVPPYAEAATYRGKPSDHHWQPYFSCKAMGEMLSGLMEEYPEKRLLVLTGHSHGKGLCTPLPNITVRTAEARYRNPTLSEVIDVLPP
jgi:hypothetical protein